jgi:soluble lytic murein transglycosylase-like protein
MWKWLLGGALAFVALSTFGRTRQGQEGASASLLDTGLSLLSGFDAIYQQYAEQLGLDWRLIKAIAQHESGEDPAAVNAADKESIGLMQVYCKPNGQGGCANKLNISDWPPPGGRDSLLDPETNVYYGAQILAANVNAYGVPKGIAVYNAWDQHTAPAGGPFKNQAYVDDVLRRARALGWEG